MNTLWQFNPIKPDNLPANVGEFLPQDKTFFIGGYLPGCLQMCPYIPDHSMRFCQTYQIIPNYVKITEFCQTYAELVEFYRGYVWLC